MILMKWSCFPTHWQEVDHFLCADSSLLLDGSLRLEGVNFLCEQLADAGNQISQLIQGNLNILY